MSTKRHFISGMEMFCWRAFHSSTACGTFQGSCQHNQVPGSDDTSCTNAAFSSSHFQPFPQESQTLLLGSPWKLRHHPLSTHRLQVGCRGFLKRWEHPQALQSSSRYLGCAQCRSQHGQLLLMLWSRHVGGATARMPCAALPGLETPELCSSCSWWRRPEPGGSCWGQQWGGWPTRQEVSSTMREK